MVDHRPLRQRQCATTAAQGDDITGSRRRRPAGEILTRSRKNEGIKLAFEYYDFDRKNEVVIFIDEKPC
ncbi:hypothetical protein EVAR_82410_1 [Eumeta japonica]|uniref:Uncharacterized protein n=1 Tax=Eumeta variegata TaxID=151549 RepID=A0A4C1UA06_EUMVA|nr:hypothetical protein EVAR_82410_1 [Eumeta japonica]